MAEPARPDVRYTAFLSYSHKDSAAAGRLHRRLEAYRMPKRLVGSEGARGPVPDRLWPIFRDREELPAATDLSETVREALAQSGALIILCSAEAAGSLWVAEEIETFRTLHPDRPILAAILAGDPPDCFPAALRAFGRDGTWHEPLATDLRPGKDGKQLGLLKLVAGITGVGLDALVQRDAARRVRRITVLSALALVALLVMAALAVLAINARREAEGQRGEAEGLIDFMMTDLRDKLEGVGRLDIMTAVNQRALQYYDRERELSGRPANSPMRARVQHAIGATELDRGNEMTAVATFGSAYLATSLLMARTPDDPTVIFVHSQSEYWVGYIAYRHGNFAAARRHWGPYKTYAEHLMTIDPRNPRSLRELGYAEGNLCTLAETPPVNAAEARRACDASLAAFQRARMVLGDDSGLIADIANRHGWAADAWNLESGPWERVQRHRDEQHKLIQWLMRREPNNRDYQDLWMRAQFSYGKLLAGRGDRAGGRQWLRRAAATASSLLANDPENVSWQFMQARILRALNEERGNGDAH
jgi:hypothetical protein